MNDDRTLKALEDMKESMAYAVRRKQQIGHEAAVPSGLSASTPVGGSHTPGPWAIEELDAAGMEYFIVPDGYRCAIADGVLEGHQDHTFETMRANARLIAAAPDLLEVVRALVAGRETMDGRLLVDENSPLIDAARTALRKVDGTARETSTVAQDK